MYRKRKDSRPWPHLAELSTAQELVNYFLTIHDRWFWDDKNSLYSKRFPANDYLYSRIVKLENPTTPLLSNKETDRLDHFEKTYLWDKFSSEFFEDFEKVEWSMLSVLREAVLKLQSENAFKDYKRWESLFVDYEKPHVERLWTSVTLGDYSYRLFLHHILPCKTEEALYHPHPWPSAMVICDNCYEMGLGYGSPSSPPPPVMGPFYMSNWSAYQMLSPLEWHYVRPLREIGCMTVMITGIPFPKFEVEKARPKMGPLDAATADGIHRFFGGMRTTEHTIEKIVETIDDYLE